MASPVHTTRSTALRLTVSTGKLAASSNPHATSAPHFRNVEPPFSPVFLSSSFVFSPRFNFWTPLASLEYQWFHVYFVACPNHCGRYSLPCDPVEANVLSSAYLSPIARMSTGVDSQQPSKLDLNLAARQRSIPRSLASASPRLVESGRLSQTQTEKMVSQSQKSRWLKTGAIIAFIFMVLLWLSPSQPSMSSFTQGMRRCMD